MKRFNPQRAAVVGGAFAASVAVALSGGAASASAKATGSAAAGSGNPLVVESSQIQPGDVQDNFNPFLPGSSLTTLGVTSLIYEPLYQANVAKAGQYYPMLATKYAWGNGGKTLTFTIRNGVQWSNGSPLTAADVAYTYNLIKSNADINAQGLTFAKPATTSGNTVTLYFTSPAYASFQNIAGEIYIVPNNFVPAGQDPAQYAVTAPVGTGPYVLASGGFQAASGVLLTKNPHYWGGPFGGAKVGSVEFPFAASSATVLSLLESNQIDWSGNFITGIDQAYAKPGSGHGNWGAPVNTNTLEPNLSKWPTNQLAVRQAISLAISRSAISKQGEDGQEAPASNASGLTLPLFASYITSNVKKSMLSSKAQPKAADSVLQKAGYKLDKKGYYALNGKEVKLDVTDPSSYSDYAEDDAIVAKELKAAHINASFVGQTVSAWTAAVATGGFDLTMHWSQTSVAPYQLYNDWLNSKLATKSNRGGNYEGLKDPAIDKDLSKLAADQTTAEQLKDLAPIESYFATQVPLIPTVYGSAWDQYNSGDFSGWPTASDPFESGSPNTPTNEIVVLHLKPNK